MQWSGLYFICVALCCLHAASEPQRSPEEDRSGRRRRSDARDGLALSREIFRNISKQLRENIHRDVALENAEHLLQNKVEEGRHNALHQGYHHHEHHWGPYFEGDLGENAEGTVQVSAHVGSEALLSCRVGMLKDKTVMWLRRMTDSAQLLTVGPAPYAGDNRVSVRFQYPNNWRLSINPVKRGDAGVYMCQISTHPPRAILTNLTVLPPVLTINDDQTHELKDKFYKAGSSIKLTCVISEEFASSIATSVPKPKTTPPPTTTPKATTTEMTTKMSTVFNRIDLVLNKSWSVETTTITSTVSVSTTTKNSYFNTTVLPTTAGTTVAPVVNNIYGLVWKKGDNFLEVVDYRNLSATVNVASARQNDSGTYTCQLQNHSRVIVNVHVLIGENQAAVHHDTWNKGTLFWQMQNPTLTSITILLFIIT